jgi:hypothetical protein
VNLRRGRWTAISLILTEPFPGLPLAQKVNDRLVSGTPAPGVTALTAASLAAWSLLSATTPTPKRKTPKPVIES